MRGISGAGHLDRGVMEHAVEIGNDGFESRFHAGNIAHDEKRSAEAVEEADIDRTGFGRDISRDDDAFGRRDGSRV